MVDHEDTKTWTKQYVTSHRADCLLFLREINLLVVRYMDEQRYYAAAVSLEVLLNGFVVMQNSGKYGELRSYMAAYSCAEAELGLFADPARIIKEVRDIGGKPQYEAERVGRNLREAAVAGLEDARDFARGGALRDYAASVLDEIKAGTSADRIRREYSPDFPEDLQEILLDIDRRFFVPEISRCAPDRCLVLDETRLVFTQEIQREGVYVSGSAGPSKSSGGRESATSDEFYSDFDAWVEACGWDEEDLEWAYKRVKFRRNLYGVLTFCTPLGILFFPFWARALYLTKAIRTRDLNAEPVGIAKLFMGVYMLISLFLYPLVMLWVIKKTNWGMGLGDKRARIPAFILLGLAVVLLVYVLVLDPHGAPIPDMVAGIPDAISALQSGESSAASPTPEPDGGDGGDMAQDDSGIGPIVSGLVHEVSLNGWCVRFTVPYSWDSGLCTINVEGENSVGFYHTASMEIGGWLFSLALIEGDYVSDPENDAPNSRPVVQVDGATLCYMGPTDVQFLDEYAGEYMDMCDRIPDILATVELERE